MLYEVITQPQQGEIMADENAMVALEANALIVKSPEGRTLAGPLTFTLEAGQRAVLVGQSGSGKSSLLNALAGFLPYDGSLRVNGVELRDLNPEAGAAC